MFRETVAPPAMRMTGSVPSPVKFKEENYIVSMVASLPFLESAIMF